jgi:hypothetical protein
MCHTCLHRCWLLDAGGVHVVEAGEIKIRHQQRGEVIVHVPNVLEQICCIDVLHTQTSKFRIHRKRQPVYDEQPATGMLTLENIWQQIPLATLLHHLHPAPLWTASGTMVKGWVFYLGREALRHGRQAQQLMRQCLVIAAGRLRCEEVAERAAGESRQRSKALCTHMTPPSAQ